MKELKQVYGRFESLHFKGGKELIKVSHSSLDNHYHSPYLQRVAPRPFKKPSSPKQETYSKNGQKQTTLGVFIQKNNSSKYVLPKISTPVRHKESEPLNYFRTESETIERQLIEGKKSVGSYSSTMEVNTRKGKLQPINKARRLLFASRSKAGTNGKKAKTNQDIAIIDVKLPFGIKFFCVCDGHGLYGHIVSAFIKANLLKNLNSSMKKLQKAPGCEQLKQIIKNDLLKTNKHLLESEINTELSGSTVVAIAVFNNKIISFNVGDSRAIKAKCIVKQKSVSSKQNEITPVKQYFGAKIEAASQWQTQALTIDQKPDRSDEAQRVMANGGRIFSQKNDKGQSLGPLRVWMKDMMMPGLAMTRSFGDKAGLKAGTSDEPEILEFDLNEDDKFIIVASDGVWEYMENQEVVDLVAPYYLKGELDLACESVLRVASEIWNNVSLSRDDITVIVVSLHEPSNNI